MQKITVDPHNTWVTSDSHFWHKNIIKHCPRTRGQFQSVNPDGTPFFDVEAMNQALIDSWNRTVPKSGTVFHLGDFLFTKPQKTEEILQQLNGTIHLIQGNHDHQPHKNPFASVQDMLFLKTGTHGSFHLCHFPMASWESHTFHLHGHSHGVIPSSGWRYDVGVDARPDDTLAPYNLAELSEFMESIRGEEPRPDGRTR